jgi:hypothetical protein
MGYYIRDFDTASPDRTRNLYMGVGLDLGKIFTRLGCGNWCGMFHYFQIPYTSVYAKSKL